MDHALSKFAVIAMLSAAVLVGCNKEDPKPTDGKSGGTPSNTTPTPPMKPATKPATMPAAATDAIKSGADITKSATDSLKNSLGTDASKLDMPKDTSKATDATKSATDTLKTATDTAKEGTAKESQSKLDEITQMIKDKKYDAADAALKKLEANKASLPEALQGKLGGLRTSLDAAKAMNGAGTSIPGLNK